MSSSSCNVSATGSTATISRPRTGAQSCVPRLIIVKAIVAHLYLVWIHPFGDGNGRTARLLELQLLLSAGFPTPATQLLSNHYNQTRSEYYRQLNAASRSGDPIPFVTYALRGFVDGLAEQLDLIFAWQREDRWEQYVYQQFGELGTEADRRRLRLVLEVSRTSRETGEPVVRADMRWLTPKLAKAYNNKTDKTLTRDLNEIRKLELLIRERRGYRPNESVLLGPPARIRRWRPRERAHVACREGTVGGRRVLAETLVRNIVLVLCVRGRL